MKILYIAQNIPTPKKKRNNVILEITKRLESKGVKVDMIYPKEYLPWGFHFFKKYKHLWKLKPWKTENINVYPWLYYRLPFSNKWSFLFTKGDISKLPTHIKKTDYDIIHSHFLFPDAILADGIKNQFDAATVITIRSTDIKFLKASNKGSLIWKKAETTLSKSDLVLTLNKPVGDFISTNFNVQTQMIPHGIGSKFFELSNEKIEKDIDVLVVASAIKRKNIDWVIKAFLHYPLHSNRSLTVVGDGPQLQLLKKLAEGNLNISFTGKINRIDVISLMQRSRIFALPSVSESFGRVYLEAATQGNAIIAHSNTGIEGVFENGKEACFVEGYKDFKDNLHALLNSDKKVKSMATNAYKKVSLLSWDNIISQYILRYQKLMRN